MTDDCFDDPVLGSRTLVDHHVCLLYLHQVVMATNDIHDNDCTTAMDLWSTV